MREFVLSCAGVDIDDHNQQPLVVRLMDYVGGILMLCFMCGLALLFTLIVAAVYMPESWL